MFPSRVGRSIFACLLIVAMIFVGAVSGSSQRKSQAGRTTVKKKIPIKRPSASKKKSASKKSSRSAAKSKKPSSKTVAKSAKPAPCQQPGYVNPLIKTRYAAAIRDMRRAGIKPAITSTWRSSAHQARLHQCSRSARCRRQNPGLYAAMPPGNSLHEAGFAIDMSGIASGPRGKKRLTSRGRRIIQIMKKNGFKWPYGLADPAHFEADPRRYGYRNAKQAIQRSQSTCQALAVSTKKAPKTRNVRSRKAAPAAKKKPTSTRARKPVSRKTAADRRRSKNG